MDETRWQRLTGCGGRGRGSMRSTEHSPGHKGARDAIKSGHGL